MLDLGLSKLAVIGVLALIVIGPEKLPRVARTVGTLLGKAQRYMNEVKAEVSAKRIKGPKRNGQTGREFPVMFDIAGKARAAKSKRTHAPKR